MFFTCFDTFFAKRRTKMTTVSRIRQNNALNVVPRENLVLEVVLVLEPKAL